MLTLPNSHRFGKKTNVGGYFHYTFRSKINSELRWVTFIVYVYSYLQMSFFVLYFIICRVETVVFKIATLNLIVTIV